MKKNRTLYRRIIIGIPCRDQEAATIALTLGSLIESAEQANVGLRIVFCLNGDHVARVESKIREFFRQTQILNTSASIASEIIYSKSGLVVAQAAIIKHCKASDVFFLDADCILDVAAIGEMVKAYERSDAKILYAQPLDLVSRGFVARLHNLYTSQIFLTKRKYFHARFFVAKDWCIPDDSEILASQYRRQIYFDKIRKFYRGKPILLADDIILSAIITKKYGMGSIRCVEKAKVYAKPIGKFFEWYRVYRRTNLEIRKIKLLYPEYTKALADLKRKTDWSKFQKQSKALRLLWVAYLIMLRCFKIYYQAQCALYSLNILNPAEQWPTSLSTRDYSDKS